MPQAVMGRRKRDSPWGETYAVTKTIYDFLRQTSLLAVGSALSALAVNGILLPQGFLSRGLTGVALLLHHVYPILSVGTLYLVLNIPVFVCGGRFVSRRFVLYSLWGLALYTLMLSVVTFRLNLNDKMLGAVIAGLLCGTGSALVLRSGGSTGGADVLYVMMHKFFSLSLGTAALLVNAALLGVATLLFPVENVLYTLVCVVVGAQVTDLVFHGLAKRQAALIISDRWQDIADHLTATHGIGLTLIQGQGAYRSARRTILYSVVPRRDVAEVKKTVLDRDPGAFMAFVTADDVTHPNTGNQPPW